MLVRKMTSASILLNLTQMMTKWRSRRRQVTGGSLKRVMDGSVDPGVGIYGADGELLRGLLVELLHGEDLHPARRAVLHVLHLHHDRHRVIVGQRVLDVEKYILRQGSKATIDQCT